MPATTLPPNPARPPALRRWRGLLGAPSAPSPVPTLGPEPTEGPSMLVLGEAFVRWAREPRQALDWVAMAAVEGREGARLALVGPGAMRARTTTTTDGLLLHGVELTPILPDDREIWWALCAVPRRAALSRVLAAIEDLAAAFGADSRSNEPLHAAIVDRLELLCRQPGFRWQLPGQIALPRPEAGAHLLLTAEAVPSSLNLRARGGRLLAGTRPETAQPWRGQDYTLLSLGPQAARQGAFYDIDRLRRQHALLHSGTAVANAVSDSYQVKSERLRSTNRLRARFGGAGMQRVPVVTPIAVEASSDLAPLLQDREGQLHPAFAAKLTALRERLLDRMGVHVPGLRLRINDGDMPPSNYIIMLEEIPLVMNTADPGMALVAAPASDLALEHIDAVPATHPASGGPACLVRREHWAVARDKGYQLLEADAVIVAHLESVLMRNLVQHARLADIEALLPNGETRQAFKALPGGLPRLCGVLQSLLAEQVPIRAQPEIAAHCLARWNLPIHEIVEELRGLPALRESLPGNDARTPLLRLSDEVVAALADGVVSEGDALVLALLPERTQELLAAVRDAMDHLPPNGRAVILVDDPRLRMPLRKLVELEFPELMVLSRPEALAVDDRATAGRIGLD